MSLLIFEASPFPQKPIAHLQGDDPRTTPRRSTPLGRIWGWSGFLESNLAMASRQDHRFNRFVSFCSIPVMPCYNIAPKLYSPEFEQSSTESRVSKYIHCNSNMTFNWGMKSCSTFAPHLVATWERCGDVLQGWETWKQKEQIQLEWEEQHLGCAFDDPVCVTDPPTTSTV